MDAPSVTILAPVSGTVSVLTAAEQQDVRASDVLGWMTNALDNSQVPVTTPHPGRITTLSLHQGQVAVLGTPVAVISRLADATRAAVAMDEARAAFEATGGTPDWTSPDVLAQRIRVGVQKWGGIAKQSGAKGQ